MDLYDESTECFTFARRDHRKLCWCADMQPFCECSGLLYRIGKRDAAWLAQLLERDLLSGNVGSEMDDLFALCYAQWSLPTARDLH